MINLDKTTDNKCIIDLNRFKGIPSDILNKKILEFMDGLEKDQELLEEVQKRQECPTYDEIAQEFSENRTPEDIYSLNKSFMAAQQFAVLIEYYGGEITDKEWNDFKIPKYCTMRSYGGLISTEHVINYEFIAFRSKEYRDKFLSRPENVQLLKDYYRMGDEV